MVFNGIIKNNTYRDRLKNIYLIKYIPLAHFTRFSIKLGFSYRRIIQKVSLRKKYHSQAKRTIMVVVL